MDHNVPFGLATSSGMQGEVADATIDIWVKLGVGPAVKWVDDFVLFRFPIASEERSMIVSSQGEFHYAYDLEGAKRMIAPLGIPWHATKGQDFAFNFPYLGFWWSLSDRTVTLTDDKRNRFKAKVDTFLDKFSSKPCTRLDAMKINGSLSHITMVYPDGRAYLPNICKFISSFKGPHQSLHPGHRTKTDLKWWSSMLDKPAVARPLVPRGDIVDLDFWMDASSSWGIGLLCEGRWAAWKWLDGWRSDFREIGWAEATAVELAVRLIDVRGWSDLHVLLRSDNQGVIGAYRRGRGRNPEINDSIRGVDVIASARNISFSFTYVESEANLADPISRGIMGHSDLQLPDILLPVELSQYMVRVYG
jgi:hypothetical protein